MYLKETTLRRTLVDDKPIIRNLLADLLHSRYAITYRLEKRRNEQIHHPLYEHIPIPIPINIGKISGGDWPSMVPDHVIIEGRYGVFFEETIEEAKEVFEQILHPSMFLDPWFIERYMNN